MPNLQIRDEHRGRQWQPAPPRTCVYDSMQIDLYGHRPHGMMGPPVHFVRRCLRMCAQCTRVAELPCGATRCGILITNNHTTRFRSVVNLDFILPSWLLHLFALSLRLAFSYRPTCAITQGPGPVRLTHHARSCVVSVSYRKLVP